jgi:N,N'-diacetylchitobiose transport system substrate-binding protein
MKFRGLALLTTALTLAFGVATASSALASSTHTLTVWLQVDPQQNTAWMADITNADNAFESANPGWTVSHQYLPWGTHLQTLDTALAAGGSNVPDVVEMGNTEMTKYMAEGAFANLTGDKSQFANSSKWLSGLAASATYNGKLYGVPYYAGSRVITYRSDLFAKAGVKALPKSLAQFQADLTKIGAKEKKVKGFAPLYVGGEDWYTALGFVFDYNGSIAKYEHGKWVGTLDSPNSIKGLTAFQQFFDATQPKSSITANGTSPTPYTVFAQGKTAANYGPAWYSCCTGKNYKSVTKQFVMPSHTPGQTMPGFLGGSDLVVPQGSANQTQAIQWIADYTGTTSEKALDAIGNIPNATNLLTGTVNDKAAARSWFVPQAVNWVDVENANVLPTMLRAILSGQLSVKQAATVASEQIAATLNQPAS